LVQTGAIQGSSRSLASGMQHLEVVEARERATA
jgi:hypothetical protein